MNKCVWWEKRGVQTDYFSFFVRYLSFLTNLTKQQDSTLHTPWFWNAEWQYQWQINPTFLGSLFVQYMLHNSAWEISFASFLHVELFPKFNKHNPSENCVQWLCYDKCVWWSSSFWKGLNTFCIRFAYFPFSGEYGFWEVWIQPHNPRNGNMSPCIQL